MTAALSTLCYEEILLTPCSANLQVNISFSKLFLEAQLLSDDIDITDSFTGRLAISISVNYKSLWTFFTVLREFDEEAISDGCRSENPVSMVVFEFQVILESLYSVVFVDLDNAPIS